MADRDQFIAALRDATSTYGTYEVTRMLHTVASETSREYMAAGNDGAIVHRDAVELGNAVAAMKSAHPLRALDPR